MRSARLLICLLCASSFHGLTSCRGDSSVTSAGDVVAIGLMIEAEDVGDSESDIAEAIHAAREINDAGGLLIGGKEYRLDVVAKDHGGSAAGGIEAIDEMLSENIQMAVGPPWSSIALGVADEDAPIADRYGNGAAMYAASREFLLVSASATSSAISLLDDDDYVWRTIASDALQAERSAGLLLERGVRTAAILHRDEAWGNGIAEAFIEAFEDSEGRATGEMGGSAGASSTGEVFASVAYDVTGDSIRDLFAYDYREELTEVFAEMPEVLVVASFDEVSRIATRMILGGHLDAYGDEPPILWLADGAYTTDLLVNTPGEVLELVEGVAASADQESEGFERFSQSFEEAGLAGLDSFAAARYDAMYAMAFAIQSADSVSAKDVRNHLRAVCNADAGDVEIGVGEWADGRRALLAGNGINYEGASGPIEFDEHGDLGQASFVHWTVVDDDGTYRYENKLLPAGP